MTVKLIAAAVLLSGFFGTVAIMKYDGYQQHVYFAKRAAAERELAEFAKNVPGKSSYDKISAMCEHLDGLSYEERRKTLADQLITNCRKLGYL